MAMCCKSGNVAVDRIERGSGPIESKLRSNDGRTQGSEAFPTPLNVRATPVGHWSIVHLGRAKEAPETPCGPRAPTGRLGQPQSRKKRTECKGSRPETQRVELL